MIQLGGTIRVLIGCCTAATGLVFVSLAAGEEVFDPPAVYLTWQQDPTTTMTVHWHTVHPELLEEEAEAPSVPPSVVHYILLEDDAGEWKSASGSSQQMPHSDRMVHTVELTGLTAATDYRFHFGANSAEFRFRTMPQDAREPIRFVTGGDLMHRPEMFATTNKHAARMDPAFAVFGGDLALCDGNPERVGRWHSLLDVYKRTMVTPDGRLIPLLVALGNHEVAGAYRQSVEKAPFFFSLFAMPGEPGYASLDFGDYMSILLLDSDHINHVDGPQAGWLASTLLRLHRRGVPHIFPVYHVPAYPSHRSYDGRISALIREHWVPLFENFGVNIAFEAHDHTYKRTHPLREGRVDCRGVVYMGDGAWGVNVREPDRTRWYLTQSAQVRHLILVTIHGRHQHVLVIDETGTVIDEFPSTPRHPALPESPALSSVEP